MLKNIDTHPLHIDSHECQVLFHPYSSLGMNLQRYMHVECTSELGIGLLEECEWV